MIVAVESVKNQNWFEVGYYSKNIVQQVVLVCNKNEIIRCGKILEDGEQLRATDSNLKFFQNDWLKRTESLIKQGTHYKHANQTQV